MAKRLFDIVAASLALFTLSPVILMIAIRIKCDAPGPVFCRIRRAGRGGIPFSMLQFRSMVVVVRPSGRSMAIKNDFRITPGGRFLGKSRLGWLPELVNVIRGDMSLVGPRPEVVEKVESYSWRERRLLALRPGISDWASMWADDEERILAGAPDAEDAYQRVIRPSKLRLQLYYLDNRSFYMDLKIIVATFARTLLRGWIPVEIRGYPSFTDLRADVARLVATEQIYRRAA